MKHSDIRITANPGLSHHCIYGIDFVSDFPFTVPLLTGRANPTLTVDVASDSALISDNEVEPLYTWQPGSQGAPVTSVYAEGSTTRVHFPNAGEFLLDQDRITYRTLPGADPVHAENRLLSPVFTLWLEQRGTPVLHASTLSVEGVGVAFLSASHGGKSSLAAALVQVGASLLSDDLLVAERVEGVWLAHPAYPQIRLWPETASYFVGETSELPRVHPLIAKLRVPVGNGFGTFQDQATPLRVIYLPERYESGQGTRVSIEPLSSSAGLMELVRHSFLVRLLHLTGQQPARLPTLGDLARAVSIRRISYPSGVDRLPEVAATIMDDARRFRD